MRTAIFLLVVASSLAAAQEAPPASQPASRPAAEVPDLPSKPVLGYSFVGRLKDGRRRLSHLLALYLRPGTPWPGPKSITRETLVKQLERIEYHVHEIRVVDRRGGVFLIIDMHPHTLVRKVEISRNWPLFEQSILRRMSLRPGTVLPDIEATNERQAMLNKEAERIQAYLAREGFFEAEVRVSAEQPLNSDQATVKVQLFKGPCYTVDKTKLRTVGNASVPDGEIIEKVKRFSFLELFGLRWPRAGLCPNRFSQEQLDDSLENIERYYQTRGFPRARAHANPTDSEALDRKHKRVRLTIEINEQKRIDPVFQGNDSISESELKSVLTFGVERSYDDVEIDNSAEEIRRRYQQKGYYQAVVTWERVRLLSNLEHVIFTIQEGPKLPVRRITFEGNRTISTDKLRDTIATRVYENYFTRGGYLTSVQLVQDKDAMVQLYQANGFPTPKIDAVVSPARDVSGDIGALAAAVTAAHHNGGLWIHWRIDEGPRNVVELVDYQHNRVLDDRDLSDHANLTPGGPFVDTFLPADVERIKKRYAEAGYPYAEVTHAVKPGRTPSSWIVIFAVTEGRPAYFGEALVRGNFRTKDWVIRKALGFQPGEPFTLGRFEDAYRGLRETRLFSSIRFDRIGEETRSQNIHLVVNVQEAHDNHGDGEFGLGYATDKGIFGIGDYAFRNIFGVGMSFITRNIYGEKKKRVQANLAFPHWLLERGIFAPVQLDLTATYNSEELNERFGALVWYEGRVTLSRRLSDKLNVAFSGSYQLFQRREDLVRVAGASEDEEQTNVETRTASIGPTVIYDARRDEAGTLNPLTPYDGYRVTAGAQFASRRLGGTDDFVKVSGTAQWYWSPIVKRVTITNGVRYDQGFPLGGEVLLPEVERFFAGGDTTVRGIEKDHLLVERIQNPLYPGMDVPMSYELIPAGGNIRFLHNLDVQFRITPRWLASAIFLDTGVVMNSFSGFTPYKLRHSVGVAPLRVTTPFATLSIEYAIPLDPQIGDDPRGRFHFNVGFVF